MLPRSPLLITMCGLPGAGKTTVAEILAARLNVPASSFDGHRRSQCDPQATMEELLLGWLRTAIASSDHQSALILDATFFSYSRRRVLYRYAAELGLPIVIVNIEAPAEIVLQRLERQRQDGSKSFYSDSWEYVRTYVDGYESPSGDPESPAVIRLDSVVGSYTVCNRTASTVVDRLEEVVALIVEQIRSGRGEHLRELVIPDPK